MFETEVADGVLRFTRQGTRWLSTSWDGGYTSADAAYNVTVPDGFDRTDLTAYAQERRDRAGFAPAGPTLLTGVGMQHARGARLGPVTCVATAGLSNPAQLPMDPEPPSTATEATRPRGAIDGAGEQDADSGSGSGSGPEAGPGPGPGPGTVNLLLGTTCALDDGAAASLLATTVEAKTATLLARTGYPGTTTDAVVVGYDPDGEPTPFAGSGTDVGAASRACVREAVTASLASRYDDAAVPRSVADAEYGTTTSDRASVFTPSVRGGPDE